MQKIDHAPIYLKIENQTYEFAAVGYYYDNDSIYSNEFDINHLYHTDKAGVTSDFAAFLDFPEIKEEVEKQLKEMKHGN